MHAPAPAFARIRKSLRAVEDRAAIDAVLDAGLVGHVGFVADGRPMVIPMAYAREGDTLYLHGASKARIVRLGASLPLCLTVTLVDGLVVARSGFHSSVNYRSVVAHGRGRAVDDPVEKARALARVVDHLMPGRSAEVREMSGQEARATGVVALEVEAFTMKRRTGPPVDDEEDLVAGAWGGVLPVSLALGRGVPDGHTPAGADEPASLSAARRRFSS